MTIGWAGEGREEMKGSHPDTSPFLASDLPPLLAGSGASFTPQEVWGTRSVAEGPGASTTGTHTAAQAVSRCSDARRWWVSGSPTAAMATV